MCMMNKETIAVILRKFYKTTISYFFDETMNAFRAWRYRVAQSIRQEHLIKGIPGKAEKRWMYRLLTSKWTDTYFNVACYGLGWFHLFYWTYKWSNEDAHNLDYDYCVWSTPGGRLAYRCFCGLLGCTVGCVSAVIWPISTPLTLVNIHDRVKKNNGFFFECLWKKNIKGLNRSLSRILKAAMEDEENE